MSEGYIPFKEVKYIPIPAVLVKYTVAAVKSVLVLLYNVKFKIKKKKKRKKVALVCLGYILGVSFNISVSTGTIKKC